MFKQVLFLSESQLIQYAQTVKEPFILISFRDPGSRPLSVDTPFVIDSCTIYCTSNQWIEQGDVFEFSDAHTIRKLLEKHARSNNVQDCSIVVQCTYGEQRSQSCAMAISYCLGLPLYENNMRVFAADMQPQVYRIFDFVFEALDESFLATDY